VVSPVTAKGRARPPTIRVYTTMPAAVAASPTMIGTAPSSTAFRKGHAGIQECKWQMEVR
jgi:hypothetical protein